MGCRIFKTMLAINKRYLIHFANDYNNFKIAELRSIAATLGFQLDIDEKKFDIRSPYLEVSLPSEEVGIKLIQRSTVARSLYELLAEGTTLSELCKNISQLSESAKVVSQDVSFRLKVDTFNKKIPAHAKLYKIEELLKCLPKFEGRVDLNTPDYSYHLLEFYGFVGNAVHESPLKLYFCRWISDGQRSMMHKFHLQKRYFIGHTSMNAGLSLIMSNMGLVDDGHIVFDPFVGTGSLLVTAAYHGAYVMGADIDYMLIHGRARPSRHNQKKRAPDESVLKNLQQYDLGSRYVDILVADSSQYKLYRSFPLFDAIITDPPYGIREASLKISSNSLLNCNASRDGNIVHYPQSTQYSLTDCIVDLVSFAAQYLKIGGRLVYWLPVYKPVYSMKIIPQHPCLNLVSDCEQELKNNICRHLITMEKVKEWDERERNQATVESNLYKEESFREHYFKSCRSMRSSQDRPLTAN